ncbi:MAG: threonylcarbamoyl-AMP synthase [Gammaproteobacteria bacterium RIFOXYB2_FULL_38_6]|nr:MAG: threonylcarbamoyl-AMP synthase [Gammaproteobacteria bacterium RIFOXYB2_FULL_38_6]
MLKYLNIHPENPQVRFIQQSVQVLREGGVILYPTDSGYALGCHLDDKEAVDRIRRIRQLDKHHHFTLMCRDLKELGSYARADNTAFRLLKAYTPGPVTFILNATKEVPRRLQHPKRKTIGLRIPDCVVTQALLSALGEPLMSVSFLLPEWDELSVPFDMQEVCTQFEYQIDLILDSGFLKFEPTTIVDLTGKIPQVIRQGNKEIVL